MANKGETKCLKVNNTHAMSGVDKRKRFSYKQRPGKHTGKTSVSLGYVLKNLLYLADNDKEVVYILTNRYVIVDKKVVVNKNLPVGLFDVIEIPKLNKYYSVVYLTNGALSVKEITKDEARYKICKIVSKKIIKKNNVQLVTNDGRTIVTTNLAYAPKASIKLDLEENTIKEYYPLEKSRDVLVISGKHVGQTAKIENITPGTMQRQALIRVKEKGIEFETTEKNIIVIN